MLLHKVVKNIYNKLANGPIYNHFNSSHNKTVLVSHVPRLLRKKFSNGHSNSRELKLICDVFNSQNYNVDVYYYLDGREIDYNKYSLIFGFGEPLINYYRQGGEARVIYYGTGMHVCYQNNKSLERISDVYIKKKKWLLDSGRIVAAAWSEQTSLVDGMILLGNGLTKCVYEKYYDGQIYLINLPVSSDPIDSTNLKKKNWSEAKYNFLWWGGNGAIHKGLDLLLDVFKERRNLQLHVCGNINSEANFTKAYHEELYNKPNIHVHGRVHPSSLKAKNLLNNSAFMIFPTCSEGQSGSVVFSMSQGLIPITTRASGIEVSKIGIEINELSGEGVDLAVNKALSLDKSEIEQMSLKCITYVKNHNSVELYKNKLTEAIEQICMKENE